MIPYIKAPAQQWEKDHNMALVAPVGIEVPLTSLIDGWIKYAERYQGLYSKPITTDASISLQWAMFGRGLQVFLRFGPTGRLDSDTLYELVGKVLSGQGITFD